MLLNTTKNTANNCTDINMYLVCNCSLCDEHKITAYSYEPCTLSIKIPWQLLWFAGHI